MEHISLVLEAVFLVVYFLVLAVVLVHLVRSLVTSKGKVKDLKVKPVGVRRGSGKMFLDLQDYLLSEEGQNALFKAPKNSYSETNEQYFRKFAKNFEGGK